MEIIPDRFWKMAKTLDSVVKLNSDRRMLRPSRASVEKELLELLRSATKHFQSKTPLSAKELLNRCIPKSDIG
jgi:hypothetical protein